MVRPVAWFQPFSASPFHTALNVRWSCVEVSDGTGTASAHCVWHRYSAFRALHGSLVARFGKLAVPPISGRNVLVRARGKTTHPPPRKCNGQGV